MLGDSPKYDRPPVRRITLTVYIEPLENFDLQMVGQLQQRWSERFPAMSQSFPLSRPDELPRTSPLSAQWPMPAVTQVASSLSRSISYQFDQISLSWIFDSEAADTTYPGYEALSKELDATFKYFAEVVERLGDTPLRVQASRCSYENVFDDIEGVDWLVGYISNWSERSAQQRLDGAEYVGFRFRKNTENDQLNTSRTVSTQLDAGEIFGITMLDIDVLSMPKPDSELVAEDPAVAARKLLEDAHNVLISTFESLASEELRTAWGKR